MRVKFTHSSICACSPHPTGDFSAAAAAVWNDGQRHPEGGAETAQHGELVFINIVSQCCSYSNSFQRPKV